MIATLATPCGNIYISGRNGSEVERISWIPLEGKDHAGNLDWALEDLHKYFSGKSQVFTGVVDFRENGVVWTNSDNACPPRNRLQQILFLISRIPYGNTVTYGELAYSVGGIHYSRFVGQVCRLNPLPVVIPCHRVVARNSLGGYAYGIKKKICLLEIEGITIKYV